MRKLRIQFDITVPSPSARTALLLALMLICAPQLGSENVTLTTYYPAPSGVYTQMITTGNTYLSRDSGQTIINGVTANASNTLYVHGRAAVGTGYTASAAPADGMIVQGLTGIGTASPGARLGVDGTGAGQRQTLIGDAGCGAGYGGLSVQGALSGCNNYSLLGDGSNMFVNRPGGNMYFRNSNADQMFLSAAGNLGVGTTGPASRVHVFGAGGGTVDLTVNGRIQTGDGGGSGGIWLSNSANMFAGQDGTDLGFWTATAGWGVTVAQRGYLHINNGATACGAFWTYNDTWNTLCGGNYVAWTPGLNVEGWSYQARGTAPMGDNGAAVVYCCPR